MPYTQATPGRDKNGKRTVTYKDDNGNVEVRVGGSAAWRNNNEGNIKDRTWGQDHGAIGHDGTFNIFPDETTGKSAKETLLRGKYGDYSSIREMLKGKFDENGNEIPNTGYAPKSDGNNPDLYADTIRKWTGLDVDNKKINNLTAEEMGKLLDAMRRLEGWREGERIWIGPDGKLYSPYDLRFIRVLSG